MSAERRRAERHGCDLAGTLVLSEGRRVPVRIRNIGPLGAMCQITDLEEPVLEGERAVLEHPPILDGRPVEGEPLARTAGAIVRVELDFDPGGIARQMAMYFDGGAEPD